jgi:hypothetical protein
MLGKCSITELHSYFSSVKWKKYINKTKLYQMKMGTNDTKGLFSASCQWLTPVILATQKAEIRRITVQSQPRHSWRDPISKTPNTKKDW